MVNEAGRLDLRASQELLDAAARDGSLTVIVPTGNLQALLAALRALREPCTALWAERDLPIKDAAPADPKDFARWQRFVAAFQAMGAVLASCIDGGDAAGAAPEETK